MDWAAGSQSGGVTAERVVGTREDDMATARSPRRNMGGFATNPAAAQVPKVSAECGVGLRMKCFSALTSSMMASSGSNGFFPERVSKLDVAISRDAGVPIAAVKFVETERG